MSVGHGLLWCGIAAGMWALGEVRSRRAAVRGAASLALTSGAVNTLGSRGLARTWTWPRYGQGWRKSRRAPP
ncbi:MULTISPECIES: hypothetical protein [unclassified Streptomyces]|uniref:hypothetical protein n=1 Tax=unclassified Streptomyces TaxID=2593676 RepID=UPI0018E94010|nr:hypothetical protein [Streptomyces sp. TSRI0281]